MMIPINCFCTLHYMALFLVFVFYCISFFPSLYSSAVQVVISYLALIRPCMIENIDDTHTLFLYIAKYLTLSRLCILLYIFLFQALVKCNARSKLSQLCEGAPPRPRSALGKSGGSSNITTVMQHCQKLLKILETERS